MNFKMENSNRGVHTFLLIIFGICSMLVRCSANQKRLLLNDQDYMSSSLHQMEVEIQNLKTSLAEKDIHMVQLQNVVHGLADRLNQKDEQVTGLQRSIVDHMNQITNLTHQISVLNNKVTTIETSNTPIAFYAYRRGDLPLRTMATHQTIIYDQVDLNMGNGYNQVTGQFTAPCNGTYVFHIATGANDNSHASVELALNGVVRDVAWADSMDHVDRSFATTVTPIYLTKGDVMVARIGEAHGGNNIESDVNIRCSFSGFKLH